MFTMLFGKQLPYKYFMKMERILWVQHLIIRKDNKLGLGKYNAEN